MKVRRGAVLWINGTARPIDELLVSEGPLGSVRVELCIPISDIETDRGERATRADILLVELEQAVAAQLALELSQTARDGELLL